MNQNFSPLRDEARIQALNGEISRWVANGYSVQSTATGQAVLTKNKRIGWFWNTILTLATGGLWLIYVIYKVVNRKAETIIVDVNEYGNVSINKARK